MALVEVQVPDIGDFKGVEIIELLVKPGDTVAVDQSLLTVESDKASMEIPSTHAGVVKEMKVGLGDKVSQGSVVLVLEAAAGAAAPAPAAAPVAAPPAAAVAAPAAAPLPAAADAGGAPIQVEVPDIGDFDQVAVIEVFVKPGDSVKVEQSLITVESDKASMEIPSSHAGVVEKVLVAIGDKVAKGSPVVLLKGAAGAAPAPTAQIAAAPAAAAATAAATPQPAASVATVAVPAHDPTAAQGQLPHASPSIRRQARELGVPLSEVKGSGPKGRITL
ncbi:MAG: E3 binding domain-containing protein, partial [Rubrivivax sp.]|nr:E3 binding domain-containing protein [Rubrivivax sp.]